MAQILLIRHGQASFGAANYDKLSPTGEQQAVVLGRALRPRLLRVDRVQTGSMLRHRQTADGCLGGLGISPPRDEHAPWNEYDHEQVIHRFRPAYKSRTVMMADMARTLNPRRAFQDMFAQAIERWMDGKHDADYTESWPLFRQRCVQALHDLRETTGKGETALVFTSGGVITAIIQELMGIPAQNIFRINWTLANCGITKVITSDRGLFLSSINEHSAFEGEHRELITYR